jgi:hypothetical protein
VGSTEIDAIVNDYFRRLEQALGGLGIGDREQLIGEIREHVEQARAELALETPLAVREVLDHVGRPEEIARAAVGERAGTARMRRRVISAVAVLAAAAVAVTLGLVLTSSPGSAAPPATLASARVRVFAPTVPIANAPLSNSTCSPPTDAATSGGSASTLTANATEVASGTVAGQSWALWAANGESGANALENGGLVINGQAYGLCPGYPNPAELELLDESGTAIDYGVIGYPGAATISLTQGTVGTFRDHTFISELLMV